MVSVDWLAFWFPCVLFISSASAVLPTCTCPETKYVATAFNKPLFSHVPTTGRCRMPLRPETCIYLIETEKPDRDVFFSFNKIGRRDSVSIFRENSRYRWEKILEFRQIRAPIDSNTYDSLWKEIVNKAKLKLPPFPPYISLGLVQQIEKTAKMCIFSVTEEILQGGTYFRVSGKVKLEYRPDSGGNRVFSGGWTLQFRQIPSRLGKAIFGRGSTLDQTFLETLTETGSTGSGINSGRGISGRIDGGRSGRGSESGRGSKRFQVGKGETLIDNGGLVAENSSPIGPRNPELERLQMLYYKYLIYQARLHIMKDERRFDYRAFEAGNLPGTEYFNSNRRESEGHGDWA